MSDIVLRRDYVQAADEVPFLVRNADGLPNLRLVDAGDRLVIWSPHDGGGLINPKGAGLRHLGLVATYARGSGFHASAFRTADLRKGRWAELRPEPENPHDPNAVALHAPRASKPFGYVQRGRAAVVAKRLAAGEDLAAVSMRGPGPRRDDDTAFLLVGAHQDLVHMMM